MDEITEKIKFIEKIPKSSDIGDVSAFKISRGTVIKYDNNIRQLYGDLINVNYGGKVLIFSKNPMFCFYSKSGCGHRVFDHFEAAILPLEDLKVYNRGSFRNIHLY